MMSELFDEQAQREQYDIAVKKAYKDEGMAEGMAKGIEKGKAEGKAEGFLEALVRLVRSGVLSIVDAAKTADLSVSEFEEKTGLKMA